MKKGQGLSMNVIIIAAIALLILVILSVLVLRAGREAPEEDIEYFSPDPYNQYVLNFDITLHWACMDGCYNMINVVENFSKPYNDTWKLRHDHCSTQCWDVYGYLDEEDWKVQNEE